MELLKKAVQTYADGHADQDGIATTPVPGVRMMRSYAPSGPIRSMYKPLVCMVLQGTKQLTAGHQAGEYQAGQSVIVGVDLPVVGHITRASREQPYLALAINLDMAILTEIAAHGPEAASVSANAPTLFMDDSDDAVLSCATRLLRMVDRPKAIPILLPSILRELHFWLLSGRHGPAIARLALPDGHARRIARAIDVIRNEIERPILVERLADAAGMSPSSFHRHFKAITSLSPLQFQKQLRLIAARRLMISEGYGASRAAFEVGYESASQFTREYGRMFGSPPRRDAMRPSRSKNSALRTGGHPQEPT